MYTCNFCKSLLGLKEESYYHFVKRTDNFVVSGFPNILLGYLCSKCFDKNFGIIKKFIKPLKFSNSNEGYYIAIFKIDRNNFYTDNSSYGAMSLEDFEFYFDKSLEKEIV